MYTDLENIGHVTFTHREIDLLACLAYGFTSTKHIAQTLSLTPRTVDVHIGNILSKIQSGKSSSRHHILAFIDQHQKRQSFVQFYEQNFNNKAVTTRHVSISPRFLEVICSWWCIVPLVGITIFAGVLTRQYFIHRGMTLACSKPLSQSITLPTLLQRNDLLQRLEKSFDASQGIPIIALVGAGGVGKTTLARLYGQKSKASIVFEVTAEHEDSLTSSFIHLAEQLIQTLEQRTTFQKIQSLREASLRDASLQDRTERVKQLVAFVYGLLAAQPSWLLIFDNVDDLSAVRPFLPPSQQERKAHKILMTTRDQNIQHSPLISSVINIGELSDDEAFDLFVQLLKTHKPSDSEKKAIQAFLAKIPPFPLDVSLAAHYIRNAHLTFDEYLERLSQHQPTFHQHEKKLWKEVSDYPETRYAIITLSTTRMLEQNPQYLDLLWTLALVDSQNIPVDLLRNTKDPSLVDPFIHALRTMSFMMEESDSQARHVFSIHRSTQAILKHHLRMTYGDSSVEATASALIQCAQSAMEAGDILTMNQLVPHFEALPVPTHLPFHIVLGMLYFHTAQYAKAQRLLEDELQYEQKKGSSSRGDSSDENLLKILIYLGNTYRELMASEKAEQTLQQALVICQQHFQKHPSEHIKLLVGLANIYRRLGNFAKAEELCSQCLTLCEKHGLTDYTGLAAIHMALCVAHREQGHYKKAEEHIHKSLDIYEHHLSHQYLDHAHAIRLLGHVCSDQGLYLQARELYQKSLDLFVQHQQPDHPKALWLYVKLGTLCRRLGEVDQAHAYLDKAENSPAFSSSPVVQGLTYHERAHLSIQQGDYDKAQTLARKSHGVYTQLFGANHVKSRRALNLVGYATMFKGDWDEAEQCMKQALQTFTQHKLPLQCQALDYLSELYRRRLALSDAPNQKEAYYQQALSYADQAIRIAEEYFPADSKHVAHLKKQKERIIEAHTGHSSKESEASQRCQ